MLVFPNTASPPMRSALVRRRRQRSGLSLTGRDVMVGRRGNHRLSQVRGNGYQGVAMIESSSLFTGLPRDILDQIATFRAAPARLATRLLHLAEQNGEKSDGGIRINLRLSQRAIGELAGVSRETTNKHLRNWSRLGWISLKRETVILRALQPLQDLAAAHGAELD